MRNHVYAHPGDQSRLDSPSLDGIYPLPDLPGLCRECERYRCRDLDGRTFNQLLLEVRQVIQRLKLDPGPDPWLWRRLDALLKAVRRAR